MFLYISYWFPQGYRARDNAVFIMGAPVTIAIASTMSGFILGMDGFLGLAGWKWLFLLEGLPAVVLGVIAYFYLADRPETAKWLSPRERDVLLGALARDEANIQKSRSVASQGGIFRE